MVFSSSLSLVYLRHNLCHAAYETMSQTVCSHQTIIFLFVLSTTTIFSSLPLGNIRPPCGNVQFVRPCVHWSLCHYCPFTLLPQTSQRRFWLRTLPLDPGTESISWLIPNGSLQNLLAMVKVVKSKQEPVKTVKLLTAGPIFSNNLNVILGPNSAYQISKKDNQRWGSTALQTAS